MVRDINSCCACLTLVGARRGHLVVVLGQQEFLEDSICYFRGRRSATVLKCKRCIYKEKNGVNTRTFWRERHQVGGSANSSFKRFAVGQPAIINTSRNRDEKTFCHANDFWPGNRRLCDKQQQVRVYFGAQLQTWEI